MLGSRIEREIGEIIKYFSVIVQGQKWKHDKLSPIGLFWGQHNYKRIAIFFFDINAETLFPIWGEKRHSEQFWLTLVFLGINFYLLIGIPINGE